jgi:hypothetical protein
MGNSLAVDLDEQALIKRPRPVGWFVAGLVTIAGLGFVLAVYLPLRAAHHQLADAHAGLARKAGELDRDLKASRLALGKAEEARDALRARTDGLDKNDKERGALVERTARALEGDQAKLIAAHLLTVESDASGVNARLPLDKLFVGPSAKLAPAFQKALCSVSAGLGLPGGLELRATVPVLAPADTKAWTLAAERAAALGEHWTGKCKAEGSRLVVGPQLTTGEAVAMRLSAGPGAP